MNTFESWENSSSSWWMLWNLISAYRTSHRRNRKTTNWRKDSNWQHLKLILLTHSLRTWECWDKSSARLSTHLPMTRYTTPTDLNIFVILWQSSYNKINWHYFFIRSYTHHIHETYASLQNWDWLSKAQREVEPNQVSRY